MTLWHLISPPLMAALFLGSLIPILVLNILTLINTNEIIMIEWELWSMNSVTLNAPMLIDKFSLIFSLTVVLISFSVMLFSTSYMATDPNLEYFIYMVMLFVLSMNLLIFIPNLFILLLGWDGLGLTSYLLVIYYKNDKSLGAGMVTAMTNRIGDALLILASTWAYMVGHWNFSTYSFTPLWLLAGSIMVATMTKSAQLPFSAWLPAAMAAPTPVSSLVHSSTLVTAGVYLLIRFYPTLTTFEFFTYFMFYTGVTTCMMAGMAASYEFDLKKVIALSTLSQLGVMMLAIGLNQPLLAFFHLVTHALFKALLFICAGTIIHSKQNTQDLRMMGNLWNSMPATCTALNTANLALCGLPFLAGFYSKDLIVETYLMNSYPLSTAFLMISSICLTAAYSMRMSILTLWSPFKSLPLGLLSDEGKYNHVPSLILLTGAITGGALTSWLILPSLEPIVLPLPLKILTLVLISFFSILAYMTLMNNWHLHATHFMSSMWFLGFITTSPTVNKTMSISQTCYQNELTWMEFLGGKGAFSSSASVSTVYQQTQNLSFSHLLTVMALLLGLSILLL